MVYPSHDKWSCKEAWKRRKLLTPALLNPEITERKRFKPSDTPNYAKKKTRESLAPLPL